MSERQKVLIAFAIPAAALIAVVAVWFVFLRGDDGSTSGEEASLIATATAIASATVPAATSSPTPVAAVPTSPPVEEPSPLPPTEPPPPPTPEPTLAPTAVPPEPTPYVLVADVQLVSLGAVISGIPDPHAVLGLRVRNNGPGALAAVALPYRCTILFTPATPVALPPPPSVIEDQPRVTLVAGDEEEVSVQIPLSGGQGAYSLTCTLRPAFEDPNPDNNGGELIFQTHAD